MGKTFLNQTSLASGEITPGLFGRVDRDIYTNGAAKLRNLYVTPLGGVRRREGTKYIANTYTDLKPRFVSFQFNIDQTYLMVFTPARVDIYRDDALVATVTAAPVTTLTADIIASMKWTQSLNTLIIVHPDLQPIQILRVDDATWTPSSITLLNIPTYDFGSGAEAVWSVTRGWPKSATFWNQRLWFGGSKSRPATVWGSKIAGFFDFDLGAAAAADAIEVSIDDDQVNAIENIFGGRTLQVFSQSSEYFSPVTLDQTATPTTFKLERGTRHGSSAVFPVSSDGATIFVERSGRVVREYVFLDVEQSYVSDDISFLSEHLIQTPVSVAIKKSSDRLPGEFTYFCNTDGTIAVLNRRRAQNFIAWSLFETDGDYEDLAIVGDDLYVCCKRSIDGSDVRFIEKFSWDYYTDAGIILSAASTTSWTGLTYLEGKDVYVRSQDGYPLLENTVTGGAITTETAQTSIEVGLGWSPVVRSLPPENPTGAGRGTTGEKRRIVQVNFNLKDSNGFTVSTERQDIRVSLLQVGDIYLNQAPPTFSGWKRVPITGYRRDPYIEITQDAPVNFELLSMTMEVTT